MGRFGRSLNVTAGRGHMRALNIHGIDDVRLDAKAPPVAGAGDAVVSIKACGICDDHLDDLARRLLSGHR